MNSANTLRELLPYVIIIITIVMESCELLSSFNIILPSVTIRVIASIKSSRDNIKFKIEIKKII